MILECCLTSRADVLVTGDNDLLAIDVARCQSAKSLGAAGNGELESSVAETGQEERGPAEIYN